MFAREVAFAAAQIRRAPHNESAWAYMRGLPALPGQAAQLAYEPGIPAICLEVGSRLVCAHMPWSERQRMRYVAVPFGAGVVLLSLEAFFS